MAIFDWAESRQSSVDESPRVQETRFGDGYVQSAPDGINTLEQRWDLLFEGVDDAVANDIVAFLRVRGGAEVFDWTPLWVTGNSPIRVVCKTWRRVYLEPGISTVTAVFERRYQP